MKKILPLFAVAAGLLAWSLRGQQPIPAQARSPMTNNQINQINRELEPVKPIPTDLKIDVRMGALGRKLFFDPILSGDNSVSCASCHSLETGGTDRKSHSLGIHNTEGEINAPTVFNSGFNFRQFWDGRAGTLEEQVDGPIHAAAEMASNWEEITRKLNASPDYVVAFRQVYPDGIRPARIKQAIAEFERSLATPNSRFDRYLRGDAAALSEDEKEGYRKFKSYGCSSCHQGVSVGGNMFETLGAVREFFAERGKITKADLGRFNVTGREEDRHVFKVPSLRNVALTSPYFHDGSIKSLEETVAAMAKYQLGRSLPAQDVTLIVGFLKTLTGEYQGRPL